MKLGVFVIYLVCLFTTECPKAKKWEVIYIPILNDYSQTGLRERWNNCKHKCKIPASDIKNLVSMVNLKKSKQITFRKICSSRFLCNKINNLGCECQKVTRLATIIAGRHGIKLPTPDKYICFTFNVHTDNMQFECPELFNALQIILHKSNK